MKLLYYFLNRNLTDESKTAEFEAQITSITTANTTEHKFQIGKQQATAEMQLQHLKVIEFDKHVHK